MFKSKHKFQNRYFFLVLVILFFMTSCSLFRKKEELGINFRKDVTEIKNLLKEKKFQLAQDKIQLINEENLSEREKAEKYNLWGVTHFLTGQYEKSKKRFSQALSYDLTDKVFINQLLLNLASSDFKLNLNNESLARLKSIDDLLLSDADKQKVYQLHYSTAVNLKNPLEEYEGLLLLNSFGKTDMELVGKKYFNSLNKISETINVEQKLTVLTKFKERNYYITKIELKKIVDYYVKNNKPEEANKLLSWMGELKSGETIDESNLPIDQEEDYPEEIHRKKIGVVLPLSGDKSEYARSVLMGLALANEKLGLNYEFIIKDQQNTPSIAAAQIRELIINEKVSLVIGGLFPTTSVQEYRATRRLGTVFLSLGPIFLPREHKREMLVELTGSIESQIHSLFKAESKTTLGEKFALLYSEDPTGQLYLEEIWRQSKEKGFQLVNTASYPKGIVDYREYIKDLFGLKFARERSEEYQKWYEIRYAQNKNTIQRSQIIPSKKEFDWIFIPSNPLEIVQIVPSFKYYEVPSLTYVGGPQWRSSHLIKNQLNLGNLVFVDRSESQSDMEMQQLFKDRYDRSAKFVESVAFDTLYAGNNILEATLGKNGASRSSVKNDMKDLKNIKGFVGEWEKEDGIWLKNLSMNQINAQGITKL